LEFKLVPRLFGPHVERFKTVLILFAVPLVLLYMLCDFVELLFSI